MPHPSAAVPSGIVAPATRTLPPRKIQDSWVRSGSTARRRRQNSDSTARGRNTTNSETAPTDVT